MFSHDDQDVSLLRTGQNLEQKPKCRPEYVYLCICCYCEEFNVQLSVHWLYPYFLCVRAEFIFTLRLRDRGDDVLLHIKRGI